MSSIGTQDYCVFELDGVDFNEGDLANEELNKNDPRKIKLIKVVCKFWCKKENNGVIGEMEALGIPLREGEGCEAFENFI